MRNAVYADTSVSAGGEGAAATAACLACLLLALCTPALAQRSEALSPVYETLVQRYHSGDREGAVAEMSGRPEHRLRDEMTAMRALSREALACHGCTAASVWERIPVRAALMLHSDCAQQARRDGRSAKLHESAAAEMANLMRDDPIHRAYARRWYEAMGGLAQSENRWGEAFDWAERGLKAFPDSADLLLVLGSIVETLSAQGAPRPSVDRLSEAGTHVARSRPSGAQVIRGHLKKARHAYRSAVAADPSRTDAWLRLGRIAWRLGDTAEARSILEDVLARKPDAATAFLAHLFLGRLDEDGGQLDGAARSYEAAIALDPQAQSARLALSHVRLRLGDEGAARRDVAAVIETAGRRPQPDPFWLYPWGPSVGVEGRLEALRREACS